MRATFRLSSPAPLALPRTTSAIWSAGISGCRRMSSAMVCAARSSARTGDSDPPKLPTGERTPSMMYAFLVTLENLRGDWAEERTRRREMDGADERTGCETQK